MNSDRLVIINGRRWGVKGPQSERQITSTDDKVPVCAVRFSQTAGPSVIRLSRRTGRT